MFVLLGVITYLQGVINFYWEAKREVCIDSIFGSLEEA
jgi:hypothetical protein